MTKINAVLFDMDGTLTQPIIDFDLIRKEIGGIEGPILEAMLKMPPDERARAEKILHQFEIEAAENAKLNPGALELIDWLRQNNIAIGLITRNQKICVNHFCDRYEVQFDSIFTREDGPSKPDPYSVNKVCEELGVPAENALMVGDYLFDIQCGQRAGSKTVLITTNIDHQDFLHEADFIIHNLLELIGVIKDIEHENIPENTP